jgi:hypothetical protein
VNESKMSVQIVRNDLIHYHAKKRYPDLYNEVLKQDKVSNSSWYTLTHEAFIQWKKFKRTVWYKERRGEKGN